MNKKQLEQEVLKLKNEINNKNDLELHSKRYIPIRLDLNRIKLFLILIVLCIITFFHSLFLYWVGTNLTVWGILSENIEVAKELTNINQLFIIFPMIGTFILISLTLISLVALIKGGYNKLNKWDEGGIILELITGLIVGLSGGLIVGLIGGLLVGLIIGLSVGLIGGLIIGLSLEFLFPN